MVFGGIDCSGLIRAAELPVEESLRPWQQLTPVWLSERSEL